MARAYWHCIRIGQYSAPPHRHKFGSVGLQPSDMPANNRSIKRLIFVLVNHSPAEKKEKSTDTARRPGLETPPARSSAVAPLDVGRLRFPRRWSPSSLSVGVVGFAHVAACFLWLQLLMATAAAPMRQLQSNGSRPSSSPVTESKWNNRVAYNQKKWWWQKSVPIPAKQTYCGSKKKWDPGSGKKLAREMEPRKYEPPVPAKTSYGESKITHWL